MAEKPATTFELLERSKQLLTEFADRYFTNEWEREHYAAAKKLAEEIADALQLNQIQRSDPK